MSTKLTSPNGELLIGADLPTVLINDQLRIMDQSPVIFEQLLKMNLDGILEIATQGFQKGMDMVDILVFHPELNEIELLPRISRLINEKIGCPISLDSRNTEALEASLIEIQPYTAIINSVTANKESLESILPLVKKYKTSVIGMPIGDTYGLPKTVEERIFEANIIIEACEGMGISKDRIVMDGVCLASSAEPDSFRITMESLKAFHEVLGVSTTLGIGNAGFGMPTPTVIDLAYLIAGVPWGLDSALVNPATNGLVETVRAIDFLDGSDSSGRRYIQWYRKMKKQNGT
jgi:5-methyltetrahydrofolate--homocysteine methyltransferase